ncbi:MAG TPA: histidinol dehydrogenase [Anaeromyxobacteraceae bacterium]|nr:histidinol dehydrogenase [Anaeromyxobacteraceae bacterium]
MKVLSSRDADFAERWARIRARGSDEDEAEVRQAAARIVADVRARGDAALLEHTRRLDGWAPASALGLVAGPADLRAAWRSLATGARGALSLAARRIEAFHRRETDSVVPRFRDALGARLSQVSRPLERVGLYVPGGTARYPSTVLMTAIPARVAGVKEVVACSPAGGATGAVDAWTLAACHAAGVSRLYKVGGAQAVAALAYGTATVTAVDKICGPGNAYVAAAKRLVFGRVDIDMIAGPSEVLVVADGQSSPVEAAADLIAQAEHDPRAVSVLVSTSEEVTRRTLEEVERQLQDLPRAAIARRSLEERGAAVVARDVAEAVRLADEFAPEHLVMLVRGAARWVKRVSRAGAVFLGSSTPEAAGDYLAGPSHVLPTAGTARFASPLSVATFRRRMSVLEIPPRALARLAPAIEALTAAEGLEGHARAVRLRLAPGAGAAGSTGGRRRNGASGRGRRRGRARP